MSWGERQAPATSYQAPSMEINDPTAAPNQLWHVTNGLLPIELMSGGTFDVTQVG